MLGFHRCFPSSEMNKLFFFKKKMTTWRGLLIHYVIMMEFMLGTRLCAWGWGHACKTDAVPASGGLGVVLGESVMQTA